MSLYLTHQLYWNKELGTFWSDTSKIEKSFFFFSMERLQRLQNIINITKAQTVSNTPAIYTLRYPGGDEQIFLSGMFDAITSS